MALRIPRADAASAGADMIAAVAIFAAFSTLYWLGRSLTFGAGDSPQHVLTAIVWGVPWPPSYPLYTFLGHLASKLPGSAAGNINGLTGLLHAAGYSLLFLTLRKTRVALLPALIGAVALGLSPLFWYYSEHAEVRALNDLLALATAFLAVSWSADRRNYQLRWLAICLGLGLSHHPTYALILPAIVVLLWGTMPRDAVPGFLLVAFAATLAPYVLLGIRLEAGQPAYNLTGAAHFGDVWRLLTRRDLGGAFRVAAGTGLFGPGGFEVGRLSQHLRWFAGSLLSKPSLLLLPFAAAGLFRRDSRRLARFWLLWLLASSLTFIVLGSQQLRLHDQEFAYAVAVRFYLLPLIALYALAASGADMIDGRRRTPILLGLLASVLASCVLPRPISLRGKDALDRYAREIIGETGPVDMIVIDTDSTFFALSYIDVIEHGLGERVLLLPNLFSFPPYLSWLQMRYPSLQIPPPGLTMKWSEWRSLNPTRALYGEVEWKDSLRGEFPNSAPGGILVQACGAPETCLPAPLAAKRLLVSYGARPTRRDFYPFSLDLYVLKHEQEMLRWTLESLGAADSPASRSLRDRLAAIPN